MRQQRAQSVVHSSGRCVGCVVCLGGGLVQWLSFKTEQQCQVCENAACGLWQTVLSGAPAAQQHGC